MHIPEGYTEEQVLTSLENALDTVAPSFPFGYFEEEDIRQEGFLEALQILPKYDPKHKSSCSLQSFLITALRRRFINLHRNKLYRNTPPCLTCSLFDKGARECTVYEEDNKEECSKWLGWYNRNQAKRSLMESCDSSKVTHMMHGENTDVCTQLSTAELMQYVSSKISLANRADYCRFIEGARLSKQRREAVVDEVRKIVGELTNGEFETWQSE